MKRIFLFLIILMLQGTICYAQFFSVKTDGIGLISGNINLGVEVAVTSKLSAECAVYYTLKGFSVVPELRPSIIAGAKYWFYENTAGHYLTIHYRYACYRNRRTEKVTSGKSHGVGVSYGYQWLLTKRISWFVEGGFGLSRTKDRRLNSNVSDGDIIIIHRRRLTLNPSRLSLGFSYLF